MNNHPNIIQNDTCPPPYSWKVTHHQAERERNLFLNLLKLDEWYCTNTVIEDVFSRSTLHYWIDYKYPLSFENRDKFVSDMIEFMNSLFLFLD